MHLFFVLMIFFANGPAVKVGGYDTEEACKLQGIRATKSFSSYFSCIPVDHL